MNIEESGSQPLQETKGLRIKFAGNKKKESNKRNRQKVIRNKQKAICAGSLLVLLLAGIAARAEPISTSFGRAYVRIVFGHN